jgi:hypothetical protein
LNTKIDFIGIGAQKAGTTWLFKQFEKSNQIQLPPVKELHYFDRSSTYLSPNILEETLLKDRMKNPKWVLRSIFEILKNAKDFGWFKKWYFSDYSDKWYLSLFNGYSKCKGEITPAYAILREEDISEMSKLLGEDTKIIFMLRNPIDRAWSSYKYKYNITEYDKGDYEDAKRFFVSDYQVFRSEYLKTIQLYKKYFNSICIAFFDAITENPKDLLFDIFNYLNLDTKEIDSFSGLQKRINTSKTIEIPDRIYNFLTDMYQEQIKELSIEYGEYFSTWQIQNNIESISPKPTIILK